MVSELTRVNRSPHKDDAAKDKPRYSRTVRGV